jgi:hypothetical protein
MHLVTEQLPAPAAPKPEPWDWPAVRAAYLELCASVPFPLDYEGDAVLEGVIGRLLEAETKASMSEARAAFADFERYFIRRAWQPEGKRGRARR